MRNKTCRRITIRLYDPEIIRMIEAVPRGLRSAVIQSALAAYFESGNHRGFINNFDSAGRLIRNESAPGQGKKDVFAQLVGDF